MPATFAAETTREGLPKRRLHLHVGNSGHGDARYEYDSRNVLLARRIRRQLHPSQLRVADLLRSSQQLDVTPEDVSASHLGVV